MALDINLSLPEGAILRKYLDFMTNEDFMEMAFLGGFATAKSNALVDRLGLSALHYPGAQILFARNTLSDLKRSSLMRLKQRWGMMFESENNVEAVYKFPPRPDPLTGEMRQSEIVCIGLDRNNLEDVMKSREFFRVGLEEGNGMSEQVHDFVLSRCRQIVYHDQLKQRDWLLRRYRSWGVSWDDALAILGWGLAELERPMQGLIGVATVFNPEPNDPIWKRYVGVQYPDVAPDTAWVNKHIGVRRKLISAESLAARGYQYQLGDMVLDPYDNPNYVLSEDKATGKVKLIKPIIMPTVHQTPSHQTLADSASPQAGMTTTAIDEVPKQVLRMVLERNAIYAWRWENESGNKDNTKASFLMEDKELQEKYFEGKFSAKAGRIFPMFDRQVHVLPTPRDLHDRVRKLRGLVGIDQGGNHATAAAFYALSRFGVLLAFGEYAATDESASTTAYNLKLLPPPGMQLSWFCDPAMRARQYATTDMASPMDRYIEAGIPLQSSPESGENAIDTLRKLLEVREHFVGNVPSSGLYIFDCCEQLIEMFETIEWKDVLTRRYKTIVDICLVGDTLVTTDRGQVPISQVTTRDRVMTRKGLRRVEWSGMTSPAAGILRVTLSDGRTLEGTASHPVWVEGKGFLSLDALKFGDRVELWNPQANPIGISQQRLSSTEVVSGDATRNRNMYTSAATTSRTEVERIWSQLYTARYTLIPTAPSLMGSMFTTRIPTRSITAPATSKLSRPQTICLSTRMTTRRWLPTSMLSGIRQRFGTLPRRAEHGTHSTGKTASPLCSRITNIPALFAGRSVPGSEATRETNTVQPNVGKLITKPTVVGWLTSLVRNVGWYFRGTSTTSRNVAPHVVRVERLLNQQAVYNLTVEGEHEFYANGILTHNCDAAKFGAAGRRAASNEAQVVQQDILTPDWNDLGGPARYGGETGRDTGYGDEYDETWKVIDTPSAPGSKFIGNSFEAQDFMRMRRNYGG